MRTAVCAYFHTEAQCNNIWLSVFTGGYIDSIKEFRKGCATLSDRKCLEAVALDPGLSTKYSRSIAYYSIIMPVCFSGLLFQNYASIILLGSP